ncbi:DUF2304 domain-containing protein [Phosphitispora sp. TUW77]|uniref:DUF2304 domain-containing protein n=1 Tax=Phosphitispora sp. TUW77 TaxID=3152361 RepID=UPI003AB2AE52
MISIFLFSALFSLGFLVIVLELVRSKRLKEQYSLLWLFVGGVMLILALWRDLIERLAEWLGIYYAPSLLFIVGILFSFALILHYSVIISRLHNQNVRLAQEVGVLNKKVEDLYETVNRGEQIENNRVDNF